MILKTFEVLAFTFSTPLLNLLKSIFLSSLYPSNYVHHHSPCQIPHRRQQFKPFWQTSCTDPSKWKIHVSIFTSCTFKLVYPGGSVIRCFPHNSKVLLKLTSGRICSDLNTVVTAEYRM